MIITLAQYKSLLGVTSSANDTRIAALIPEVEAKYLQIRNIPFITIQGTTTGSDKTVSNIKIYSDNSGYGYNQLTSAVVNYLNRMDYLFSVSPAVDNYITDIDIYANTLELDTAPSSSVVDAIFTIYPQGSKYIAAKLIQYLLSSNAMNGLQSESVGSYSWSAGNFENPYGVPNDIYKSIKRYVNI